MKRKISFILGILFVLGLSLACASAGADSGSQTGSEMADAAALVMDIPTTQAFVSEAVPASDVEKILLAGVNAPSAMNKQPWHFSAVTDASVLEKISSGMGSGIKPPTMPADASQPAGPDGQMPAPDGAGIPAGMEPPKGPVGGAGKKAGLTDAPLAIIVSCVKGSELDAGLACQNMSVEAQLLGYGTKIVTSPIIALNGERQAEFAQLLGIPDGQAAVAVLLVGREDAGEEHPADAITGATSRNPLSDAVTYVFEN